MKKHTIKPKVKTRVSLTKAMDEKMQPLFTNNKTALKTAKGRKIASTIWLQRQLNDPFYQASKIDKFLSRAAYKLIEIDHKYGIFRPEQMVIDLGCAPGSWLQVIWNKIRSKNSRLIGVDLLPVNHQEIVGGDKLGDNLSTLLGDFTDPEILQQLLDVMGGRKADAITSDIAPNATGIHDVDHLLIVGIANHIISFALNCLSDDGYLILKLFQGSDQNVVFDRLKSVFKQVHVSKPKASRKDSSEFYIVCSGLRAKESGWA